MSSSWRRSCCPSAGRLRKRDARVLNVAGNAITTFMKAGHNQSGVNLYVFDVLELVHRHWGLHKVISGGQTGADIAGIIAAHRLGVDATALLPKGFLQRNERGQDVHRSAQDIAAEVLVASAALRAPARAA